MSTLKLSFDSSLVIGDNISINIDIGGSTISLNEIFVTTRQGAGQINSPFAGVGGDLDPEGCATGYIEAWNLDYKNTGYQGNIIAFRFNNEVTLTLDNPAWFFLTPTGSAFNSNRVTHITNNADPQPAKSLEVSGYSQGSSVCDNIDVSFTATGGTGSYDVYVNNTLTLNGVTSPFTTELGRGTINKVRVIDTNGSFIGELPTVRVARKLIPDDISIGVVNLESGATIDLDVNFISSYISNYSYSLDGVTYKSENIFTGIADGNYTLYVKDAFGCVTQKAFVVDGVTELTEVVFNISKVNALRFAKYELGKKNRENTLSCHELKQVAYPFYHKYRNNDVITTQFKTNAPYIHVYRITPEGTTDTLTATKQTANIGVEKNTTSTYFDLGGGRSALYFGVVDVLDTVDDSVLETVDYGFTLPEFANEAGKYVNIEGIGQVKINSIGYSDTYESFVAEFNIAYTGAPVTKKVYAKYNLQPYEVYEFTSDVSLDHFNIVIEVGRASDDITHTYVSEAVKQVSDSDKLLEIRYKDSKNKGDMNYQTGIEHLLLLEGYSDYIGEQETEGYNGDTDYFVTDNQIYDTEKFIFDRVSSEVAHKLRLVFAHETVSINGLSYKIGETPEINTNINSNFKTFSVLLKRGGEQFLDTTQEIIVGSSENEALGGAIEASQGQSLILWTKQN